MTLQTLQQDARSELGNKFQLRGRFGELQRLQDRLESGELTDREALDERQQFKNLASELEKDLQQSGLEDLAFELACEAGLEL